MIYNIEHLKYITNKWWIAIEPFIEKDWFYRDQPDRSIEEELKQIKMRMKFANETMGVNINLLERLYYLVWDIGFLLSENIKTFGLALELQKFAYDIVDFLDHLRARNEFKRLISTSARCH